MYRNMWPLALYVGLLAKKTENLGNFSTDKQGNEVKQSRCWDKQLPYKSKEQPANAQWFPRSVQ